MFSARIVVSAVAGFCACAPADAIVGRGRDGDSYASQVVMVLARQGGRQSVCSGVALAPRLVLTAAHCLASAADTLVAVRRDGRSVPVAVSAVARHPGYDKDATRARRRSIDLALIQTAAPLEGFAFPEIAESETALDEAVTVVGFGVTREGGPPSDGQIRAADLVVAAPLSGVTLWAKDPGGSGLGACHGDSGGPMFDTQGRLLALVAWTNGRDGRGCGAITQGPLIAPAKGWIAEIRAGWGQ